MCTPFRGRKRNDFHYRLAHHLPRFRDRHQAPHTGAPDRGIAL